MITVLLKVRMANGTVRYIGWGTYGNDMDPWRRETSFFHISAKGINAPKWDENDYATTLEKGVEKVRWALFMS